jgi:hypothetical protein
MLDIEDLGSNNVFTVDPQGNLTTLLFSCDRHVGGGVLAFGKWAMGRNDHGESGTVSDNVRGAQSPPRCINNSGLEQHIAMRHNPEKAGGRLNGNCVGCLRILDIRLQNRCAERSEVDHLQFLASWHMEEHFPAAWLI